MVSGRFYSNTIQAHTIENSKKKNQAHTICFTECHMYVIKFDFKGTEINIANLVTYSYCNFHNNQWDASLCCDDDNISGVNPKINNMLPAYQAAVYPLILVSDSSIKMKEDTLADMVASMTENVGLVHQMPCE